MTFTSTLRTSPQKADPLTWILAFNLPLIAVLATAAGGFLVAIMIAPQGVSPFATLLATTLSVLGCLVVQRAAQPHRPLVRPGQAALPMALGVASMLVSAFGHRGSSVPLGEWTGPLGLATVMLALVPYLPGLVVGGLGLIGAVIAGLASRWAFDTSEIGEWSAFIAGSSLPFHVGVAGAAFSGLVVAAVTRWRALPYDREETAERPSSFVSRLQQHGTPVAIGDDVLALLQRVADGARVSAKERADAASLAAGIRADLVEVVNRSWLETIPQHERLSVEDPDGAANRMTRSQRSAIHTLISAALESPVLAGEALRIELRSLDDGTTAVAFSMNITLPEGRRVMMLAPYFISLKASVDDLEWAVGEQLRMRFKLPPADEYGD
ncbi:hypothetical protein FVA74_10320 [Salinibacterium sp. dk2585]|uniref:hypothetical protein n=1 Tax=unclassified Salinibacterium TaxID=2632331 RepID=UPI0011C2564F|nr:MULTISPECIES: hypothetical protein [unclassified Salinibacterium]QEE61918.1 hypothetical protein FVA74_10320 [Salinibacterium sp. dk2585]TXK54527.1 hypothetical protein FVP63_05640 [Salinibacterium sp. dk5596]